MSEIKELESLLTANEMLLEEALKAKDTQQVYQLLTHRNLIKTILLDMYRQQKEAA